MRLPPLALCVLEQVLLQNIRQSRLLKEVFPTRGGEDGGTELSQGARQEMLREWKTATCRVEDATIITSI